MTRIITMDEVSRHTTCDDFWTVIGDKVYDLSGYASKHPGGSLLMAAAGCDGTALFHQYHLMPRKVSEKILARKQIGVISQASSPVMGDFYDEVATEVSAALKDLPPRPRKAKILFYVDYLAVIALTLGGASLLTSSSKPLIIFAIAFALEVFCVRLAGQCHAVGHLQVFGKLGSERAELALLAFGGRTMPAYGLPTLRDKFRARLHLPRGLAQYEFFRGRGPYEHQGLHHVSGADLEHDQCYLLASLGGLLRLSDRQAPRPIHRLQRSAVGRFLTQSVFTLVLLTVYPLFKLGHLFTLARRPQRNGRLMAATLIGVVSEALIVWVVVILPLLAGAPVFLALVVARRFLNPYLLIFNGQHVWDSKVTEAEANRDWGRHNCATNISLSGDDMIRFPFTWGQGGSNPSTLTYHTEHTLFPGVCYLYLPVLAPIVERVALKHGVPYNAFTSFSAFSRHMNATLESYSTREALYPVIPPA